jgi:hypothetical protein
MKNKFNVLAFLLFVCLSAKAQDSIFKMDGTVIVGKIIQISEKRIDYTSNGIIYSTNADGTGYIRFSNGVIESFNVIRPSLSTPTPEIKHVISKSDKKNIFAVNLFEIPFIHLGFSYERIFNHGNVSLKVPFSFSLGGPPDETAYIQNVNGSTNLSYRTTFMQNKIVASGLELNYYPVGQTRQTFYIGLSGLVGSFYYYSYDSSYYTPYYYSYYPAPTGKKRHMAMQYAGMVHLGGYITLTKNLLIGTKFALGYRREETIYVDYTMPKFQLDVNLALRF